MSTARNEILRRIRSALRDVPAAEQPSEVPVARDYRHAGAPNGPDVVARFAERVAEYKATVSRVTAAELPGAIAQSCARRGIRRLVIPTDLPEDWAPADVEIASDE